MIVAGLQFDIAWEDPWENFARVERLVPAAVAAGARLLVLPEMFATGFSMAAERVAAPTPEIRDFLAGLAQRHGLWVLAGFVEPGDPLPLNVCALFNPEGEEKLHYTKIHPFSLAGEPDHYGAGARLATHKVEGLRVTPFICYDLRFPEVFRAAADRTDLYLVIANWPTPRADAWRLLLRARAIENQAFVLGVNRVGEDPNGHHYSGNSVLLDPLGHEIASAAAEPTIVAGEVDPKVVAQSRAKLGFLADKRFTLYRELYAESGRGLR
ncbi:MAG: nitrilase-related carbon-nitrogen hydrolase [Planctomycetota bacterium]